METRHVRSLVFTTVEVCLRNLLFDMLLEIDVVVICSSRIQQGVLVEPIADAL